MTGQEPGTERNRSGLPVQSSNTRAADSGLHVSVHNRLPIHAHAGPTLPSPAAGPFSSASSGPRRVFPAVAAPVVNASAVGPSSQNCCSAAGPAGPPAGCGSWAAVVLVADRGHAGGHQGVLGDRLTIGGHDDQHPAVFGVDPDLGTDQPGGHRVANRGETHAGQPINLIGHPGAGSPGRHDHVGDHRPLQAPHPFREHRSRDPAEHLEAVGEHRERRLGALIGGEPHEPAP